VDIATMKSDASGFVPKAEIKTLKESFEHFEITDSE